MLIPRSLAVFSNKALLRVECQTRIPHAQVKTRIIRELFNDFKDGSTLADNLIKSHHVDFLSAALISAKSVDNVQAQEHHAAIRYSTIY